MSEQAQREAIAAASKLLSERGWVANHDGNITVRLDDGRILATPTAVSKRLIGADDVLLLGADGKLAGEQRKPGRPFSELHLHLRLYKDRSDARAVVHAHPPTATAFAVAGLGLAPSIAEAVVSIGPGAPLVPYARPGSPESEDGLSRAMVDADVALMASHGVIAVGVDVEQAYLRVELVEHLAKIELAARQIGRVNALPREEVAYLLERRTAAGLGPAARGQKPTAPTPSPMPTASEPATPIVIAGGRTADTRPAPSLADLVEQIVREELARATRRG